MNYPVAGQTRILLYYCILFIHFNTVEYMVSLPAPECHVSGIELKGYTLQHRILTYTYNKWTYL